MKMEYLSKDIDKMVFTPISDSEIKKMMCSSWLEKPGVNIVTFKELQNYSCLEKLIGNFDRCVILYETDDDYGHWCCVFRTDSVSPNRDRTDMLVFFDSYGSKIDQELSYVPERLKRNQRGVVYPYVLGLMSDYCERHKMKAEYNEMPFQSNVDGVATCGRWCVVRMFFGNMNEKEFYKYILDLVNLQNLTSEINKDLVCCEIYNLLSLSS